MFRFWSGGATRATSDPMPPGLTAIDGLVRERLHSHASRMWVAYGVLLTVLVIYVSWAFEGYVGARWVWVNGWGVDTFEALVALLCISRALVHPRRPVVPLALGTALLAWCAGDVALTIESLGGATPSSPSAADAFYLTFYPLAYVGVVLFIRSGVRHLTTPSWLDGVIAGTGAAAVCSAFAFHTIMHAAQSSAAAAAINLAYPIGDLLLLALVVGGTAILPGRTTAPWLMMAGACALNTVGDTMNLFQSSIGATRLGSAFDAVAWPGAFLLMSAAMWVRPRPADPLARRPPTGFLLPGIGAVAGLAILLAATYRHLTEVSVVLAAVTLVFVGVRLAISSRNLRLLTEDRHVQSITDELTGLGNRRRLMNVLQSFFNDRAERADNERKLAFLFVDLDHFKEINDSFGHAAGDEVLRRLGPRLAGTLRGNDVIVRLGGDEFAAVLLDADSSYAREVSDRLLQCVREPFQFDVVTCSVGASIGIALVPDHATDASELMRCADVAMYRAKLSQSAIESYDSELDDDGNLLKLAEELRAAVVKRQFVLHYQPQLELSSGRITCVEALLRWPHQRLGLVPPLKFLPVAEEAGLMPALTEMVLEEALTQCAAWRSAGAPELRVSINVSPSNLLQAGFCGSVVDALDRHDLPAESLALEITETCIISDYKRSKVVIEELRSQGVTVSIDDFGAGFTSLAYLSQLAVGELKLDRSFVVRAGSAEPSRDIDLVRYTIELGHALGLRVVAEGVEDGEMLELLRTLGCDLAQGFFISKPMLPEELDIGHRPLVHR